MMLSVFYSLGLIDIWFAPYYFIFNFILPITAQAYLGVTSICVFSLSIQFF
jgi:hypothetical protein